MGWREKKTEWMNRATEQLELSADWVAGMPYMELLGDREFYMEHHRGILSYDTACMVIQSDLGTVQVKGEGLELLRMTEEELRIGGHITAVEWVR